MRRLYQLDRSGEEREYKGVIDCYKKTYTRYGITRFYRGLLPRYVLTWQGSCSICVLADATTLLFTACVPLRFL